MSRILNYFRNSCIYNPFLCFGFYIYLQFGVKCLSSEMVIFLIIYDYRIIGKVKRGFEKLLPKDSYKMAYILYFMYLA